MAKSKTIGSAIVKFLAQGFEKLQTQLGVIKGGLTNLDKAGKGASIAMQRAAQESARWWNQLGQTIEKVGRESFKFLAIGAAGILGFTKLADPKGLDAMTVALGRVGIQLGRFFVPLIREATALINRLADWLKSLSDETRENVLQFVRMAGAIIAVTAAAASLLAFVIKLGTGWTLFIGIVAGLVKTLDPASATFIGIKDTLIALGTALMPLIEAFGKLAAEVLPLLLSVIQPVLEILVNLASFVVPLLVGFLNSLDETWVRVIGTFLIALVIVPKIIGIFSGLFQGIQLAIGGIRALSSAFTAFLANPWILAITLIVAAVAALAMSMRGVGDSVDDVARRTERMADVGARARAGGTVSRRDLGETVGGDLEGRIVGASPADRRRIAAEARATAERDRAGILARAGVTTPAELEAREGPARAALEGIRDLSTLGPRSDDADAIRERMRASGFRPSEMSMMTTLSGGDMREFRRVEALRGRGVGEEDITRLRTGGALTTTTLSDESMRSLMTASGPSAEVGRLSARIDTLRAVEEGRFEGDGGRFRGEAKAPKVDIVGVMDAWKRIQTAQTEDPRMALEREALAEARGARVAIDAIRADVSGMRGRPMVPGS